MSMWFSPMTPRWRCSPPSSLANSAVGAGHPDDRRRPRRDLGRVRLHRPARPHRGPELDAVRAIRRRLRELLTADRDDGRGARQRAAQRGRRGPPARPARRAATGTSTPSTWTPRWPTRIIVETAMAMVDVIRADEMSRLGICADDTCEGIVLDLSRNRSRRFCSTTCGNRNAVAAYRARQRRTAARRDEPAEHLDEHLGLLGVHPVPGALDRHPAVAREPAVHRGDVLAATRSASPLARPTAPARRTAPRRRAGPPASPVIEVEVAAEEVEVEQPVPPVALATQALQQEAAHHRRRAPPRAAPRPRRRGAPACRGRCACIAAM